MNREWRRRAAVIASSVIASLLPACSGIEVKPVLGPEGDRSACGFRYYEESPYLLVYSDGSAGLTSRLIYLPDPTRKMSARPYQFLASNQVRMEFADGVLGTSKNAGDSTAIPKAIVEAAKSVAMAAMSLVEKDEDSSKKAGVTEVPVPVLFKIVVNGPDSKLIAGSAVGANGEPVELGIVLPEEQGK